MGNKKDKSRTTIIELRFRRDEILEKAYQENPIIQKLTKRLEAEKMKIINSNDEAKAIDDEIKRRMELKINGKNKYSRSQNKTRKKRIGVESDRRFN